MMITRQVFYEGHVQGVGFRYTTKQIAMGFDVVGWVRNLADGRVELQVEGDEDEVADFFKEIEDDSVLAGHVRSAERHDQTCFEGGVSGFSIR